MRWSLRLLRIAGTEVKIHFTFLLLLAWIWVAHYRQGGTPAAIEGVLFVLLLFLSVLLHEFGHALAARRYGIPTPDITLLPIGGVARIARMPDIPRQELFIALAGPAVNVVIAAVLYGALGYLADLGTLADLEDPRLGMMSRVLVANVTLVLFNLLPAFPMDGGRVLRALLAMRLSYVRATRIATGLGQLMAAVFLVLGYLYSPLLILIALFVFLAARQENTMAEIRSVPENLRTSSAMITDFRALPPTARLLDAFEILITTRQREIPVIDEEGNLFGILTHDDFLRALAAHGPHHAVGTVMRRNLPPVHWQTPFDEALQQMHAANSSVLPVADDQGRMIGLITPENIGEVMRLHAALSRAQKPTAGWLRMRPGQPPFVP